MALFDGKISLQTSLDDAWKAAQQTLTPAEKIVTSTPNAAFAAMDGSLGYLYIFRARSNGEIAVRLLIDEATRVREVFRTYKGAEALDMLAAFGSSDLAFTERINQLGKQRLKHIEEIVSSAINTAAKVEDKAVVPFSDDNAVQSPPAPDWLMQIHGAGSSEDQSAAPKMMASPYAEPIVSDKRQLWWVVGIISTVFIIGFGILILLVGQQGGGRDYDGQWFSLKLPSGWSKIAPDSRTQICPTGTECPLVIGKDPYHFVALYFSIETSPTALTQQDIETKYWFNYQAAHPDFTFAAQRTEQMLGRSAVNIEYLVPNDRDIYYLARHIVILNPTTTLHVVGYAISAFQYEETRHEIDQIIQTITIKS